MQRHAIDTKTDVVLGVECALPAGYTAWDAGTSVAEPAPVCAPARRGWSPGWKHGFNAVLTLTLVGLVAWKLGQGVLRPTKHWHQVSADYAPGKTGAHD